MKEKMIENLKVYGNEKSERQNSNDGRKSSFQISHNKGKSNLSVDFSSGGGSSTLSTSVVGSLSTSVIIPGLKDNTPRLSFVSRHKKSMSYIDSGAPNTHR